MLNFFRFKLKNKNKIFHFINKTFVGVNSVKKKKKFLKNYNSYLNFFFKIKQRAEHSKDLLKNSITKINKNYFLFFIKSKYRLPESTNLLKKTLYSSRNWKYLPYINLGLTIISITNFSKKTSLILFFIYFYFFLFFIFIRSSKYFLLNYAANTFLNKRSIKFYLFLKNSVKFKVLKKKFFFISIFFKKITNIRCLFYVQKIYFFFFFDCGTQFNKKIKMKCGYIPSKNVYMPNLLFLNALSYGKYAGDMFFFYLKSMENIWHSISDNTAHKRPHKYFNKKLELLNLPLSFFLFKQIMFRKNKKIFLQGADFIYLKKKNRNLSSFKYLSLFFKFKKIYFFEKIFIFSINFLFSKNDTILSYLTFLFKKFNSNIKNSLLLNKGRKIKINFNKNYLSSTTDN